MDMHISELTSGIQSEATGAVRGADKGSSEYSFGSTLKKEIQEVDRLQQTADQASSEAAVKGATNMHETMIKVEEADIGMRMFLNLRGKAMEAYNEVMKMQF
jgi:flagellar hook-basal body complex protein FliE